MLAAAPKFLRASGANSTCPRPTTPKRTSEMWEKTGTPEGNLRQIPDRPPITNSERNRGALSPLAEFIRHFLCDVGKSALHWAAAVNNVEALVVLLRNGADKDMQDSKEETPLFIAAREGSHESARILLESQAQRETPNFLGRTPHDVAIERSHHDIVRLLEEPGPVREPPPPPPPSTAFSPRLKTPRKGRRPGPRPGVGSGPETPRPPPHIDLNYSHYLPRACAPPGFPAAPPYSSPGLPRDPWAPVGRLPPEGANRPSSSAPPVGAARLRAGPGRVAAAAGTRGWGGGRTASREACHPGPRPLPNAPPPSTAVSRLPAPRPRAGGRATTPSSLPRPSLPTPGPARHLTPAAPTGPTGSSVPPS
ncbi:uncharacterized protein [Hemitrygon akajei]|uniref:uncharacterized protein n=1 Tax=Hemitrygon akajei TaxID=2704970 RepID=UPI003BF9DD6B